MKILGVFVSESQKYFPESRGDHERFAVGMKDMSQQIQTIIDARNRPDCQIKVSHLQTELMAAEVVRPSLADLLAQFYAECCYPIKMRFTTRVMRRLHSLC